MFKFIAPLIATLVLAISPSIAGADVIYAEGGAGATVNGTFYKVSWTLLYDDVADTVTIDAIHTTRDGSPAPDPQTAIITIRPAAGQDLDINLITGHVLRGNSDLGLFDPVGPEEMLNSGPRTRTNTRLKVDAGRAHGMDWSTTYNPPLL